MAYSIQYKDLSIKNIKYFFVLIFLLISTHQIFNIEDLPRTYLIFYLIFVVGIIFIPLSGDKIFPAHTPLSKPTAFSVLLGTLISLPAILYLAFTWNQDLPLWGDHQAHTAMSYGTVAFWAMAPGIGDFPDKTFSDVRLFNRATILGLLAFGTVMVLRYKGSSLNRWLSVSSWVAMVIFMSDTGDFEYLRYPSTGYFFDIPFNSLVYLVDGDRLWNGPRVGDALSPAIWLFVLRPIFLRKWPDIDIFPWALVIFWSPEALHYFSSSYLEPWAVIFALLSIEILVRHRSEGAAGALLLTGIAASIKEPFILALPAIWLVGLPWQGVKRCSEVSFAGLIAGIPFLSYLYLRYHSADQEITMAQRGFDFRHDLPVSGDFMVYFEKFFESVGAMASGVVILSAILILCMCFIRRVREVALANIGSGALIFSLFFFDKQTSGASFAGMYRFAMSYLPFISSGLLIAALAFGQRIQTLLAAVAFIAMGPGMIKATSDTLGPDPVRAGIEWGSAPVFIGFPSLINRALKDGVLPKNVTVAIEELHPLTRIFASPPRFIRNDNYTIKLVPQGGNGSCTCSTKTPYRFKPFLRMGDHRSISIDTYGTRCPRDMAREQCINLSEINRGTEECLVKMTDSCEKIYTEWFDGDIYAIFGLRITGSSNDQR